MNKETFKGRIRKITAFAAAVAMAVTVTMPGEIFGNIDFGITAFAEDDGYVNGFCTEYELNGVCNNQNHTNFIGQHECNGYQRATDDNNDGVFEIGNAGQLYWFADMIIKKGAVSAGAILTDDITVNENVLTANGELNPNLTNPRSWTPIGYPVYSYKGTFDGQGHKISGLYFNDENETYIGLFKHIDKVGKVINVGVVDNYFSANYFVGGICGQNDGTIENCYNAGTVKASFGSTDYLGGISGSNEGGSIIGCFNTGNVSGSSCYIGGICGASGIYQEISGSIIKNCYNAGKISTNDNVYGYIGGLCGANYGTKLENCYNTGELVATYWYTWSGSWDENAVNINCYYLWNYEDGYGGKTSTQFKSGEVCRLVGYHSYMNDKCTLCGNVRLTNVSITISEPKSAENLATTASVSTTGVAADPTISWQPAGTSAAYNTAYTASVKLSASTGYVFADSVSVSVNDTAVDSSDITYNVDGTITVAYTFGATDKKTLSSSDFNFTPPDDLIYNYTKSKKAVVTAISSGVGSITAVKYFDVNGTKLSSAPINAGTYTVKIDVEEGDDFKAITDLTSDSWKFTIKPKVITKSDLEFLSANFSKIYDGTTASTAKMQIKSNVVGIDAVEIRGTAVYNSKDVKDAAKVTFTPTAITDGNYTLASTETVEHSAYITTKPITPTVEITGTYSYTGTAITPTFTVKDGDTLLVKDTDYSYVLSNNTNVGTDTAKITVKSVTNGNYSFTDTEKTFTIGKGTPSISAPTASAITLGQTLAVSTLSDSSWRWSDPTTEPTFAGTHSYTAEKTVSDADKYDYEALSGFTFDSATNTLSTSVSVVVNRVGASVTLPTASNTLTYGQTLANAGLTAGWTWENASTVPDVNNTGYIAYKIVTDYDNFDYSNLTGFDYDETNHKLSCNVSVTVTPTAPIDATTASQSFTKGTASKAFAAPIFKGIDGKELTGSVSYTYGGQTYTTTAALTAALDLLDGGESGTIEYTFTPDSANYTEASGSISFTVIDAVITGITIKSAPTKTAYEVGDTIDLTGGQITVSYNNNTSVDIDITAEMISGFDSTTAGEKTVTVTYGGKTTSFNVTIKPEAVDNEHTHSYDTNWSYDETYHWHECECGEKSDVSEHIEDSGTVTTEPTETTEGERTFKCEMCGYIIRTETIPVIEPSNPEDPDEPSNPEDPDIPDSPEEKVNSFVERLYKNVLGRHSDPSKKSHIDNLNNGETATKVAYDFVFSPEFTELDISNEERVTIMYNTFLNRDPDPAGLETWTNALDNGCSIGHIFYGFTQSGEFGEICDAYGIEQGTWEYVENRDKSAELTAFVSRLYTKALNRTYDVNGLNDHTGTYLENHDLYQMAYNFIFSPEFMEKNLSDEEFVDTMYRTFFDREADPDGKADWLDRMANQGYSREDVLAGFVGSQEFVNLVAKFGI